MTTSGEAEPSTDLLVESELAETCFVASEEPPEAGGPESMPWWKRIFAFARRPSVEAIADVAPSEEAALRVRVSLSDVAEEAPEEIEPEVSSPSNGALEALPSEEEAAPELAAPAAPTLSVAEGVGGLPLTLDDVRALVREELSRARDGVSHIVQAELAREWRDRLLVSLTSLQGAAADVSDVKPEFLITELDLLNEAERRTLQGSDNMPLRERMELVDFIRERRAQVKQQIVKMEAAIAQRVAGTDLALAELGGCDTVASLHEELERQRQEITAVKTELATWPKAVTAGLGPQFGGLTAQWATLMLVVLLVVAVGVAGILLPGQTESPPSLLVEMATLYQATGEKEAAIELLDEAVEAGIEDVEARGQVGQTYYALKEYDKALEVLERVVEEDPQNGAYLLTLARSYGKTHQHQKAIAQYGRLIEIEPGNWRYRAELGQSYASLEDYDRALAEFQRILELDPDVWQGYFYQGNVYRILERYGEAIAQYQKVVELNPNHYWAWVYYGLSYAGKGDLSHAIGQYAAAIAVDPERADAYYYLGEAHLAQGHFEEALEPYQRAVTLRPDWAAARLGLGKVYLNLDDCEGAKIEFLEILRFQPDNEEAQQGMEACGIE